MPIRRATLADAEAIAHLHIASWRTAYRPFVPAAVLDAQDVGERTALFTERMTSGDTDYYVDDDGGRLRGFVSCGPAYDPDLDPGEIWTIRNLHVTPALRGRGLGGPLFAAAVDAAAAAGAAEITLWVIEGNVPARRFYERTGMRPDGGVVRRRLTSIDVELPELRYRMPIRALGT